MLCSRNANNLINKIKESSLRLITNDKAIAFEHLVQINNETTKHQRNLQVLMLEVFKIINGFVPSIMEDFFSFRENNHNIWNFQIISNDPKETVRYGLETVKYRTPLLLANLLEKYKTATSLNSFKTKIKTRKFKMCICRYARPIKKTQYFLSSTHNRDFWSNSARCWVSILLGNIWKPKGFLIFS